MKLLLGVVLCVFIGLSVGLPGKLVYLFIRLIQMTMMMLTQNIRSLRRRNLGYSG